jgi:hypothetical protein
MSTQDAKGLAKCKNIKFELGLRSGNIDHSYFSLPVISGYIWVLQVNKKHNSRFS